MRGFFHPQSLAVIGVSPRPENLARAIVNNLIHNHYQGRLFLVGRSGGNLYGHPIRPSLADLPEAPEAAVILTPAATVPELVRTCGEMGIRRLVIESGGFSELDDSGQDLEAQVLALAREYHLRLIGPNGIGVINKRTGLTLPFPPVPSDLRQGGVSLITQSGGVGVYFLGAFKEEGIGLAKFASVGNKLDVDEVDLLEYFLEDAETEAVCLYLESIGRGRRLFELARGAGKPILLHKSNTSAAARAIAASHTAALSADDEVLEAACLQAGIIRVRRLSDMLGRLKAFGLPRLKGRRIALVSRSGGLAVVGADACAREGLDLPALPQDLKEAIQGRFRAGVIKVQNPVDLGDLFDFDVYSRIAESLMAVEGLDGMVFAHGYRGAETAGSRRFVQLAASLGRKTGKPLALCLLVQPRERDWLRENLNHPFFRDIEEAVSSLADSLKVHGNGHRPAPPALEPSVPGIEALLSADGLGLTESLTLAQAAGLALAPFAQALDESSTLAAAERIGYPVALKVDRPELSHKTEAGGVMLDVAGPEELKSGLARLRANLAGREFSSPFPVVVQAMVREGLEIILGGRQDPVFGPVVLLGLGGIWVEALRDVSLRLCPVTQAEALEMAGQLKAARLLTGFRGRPGGDINALGQAVARLSQVLAAHPRIKEIDLNPVKLLPPGRGLVVLDARVGV